MASPNRVSVLLLCILTHYFFVGIGPVLAKSPATFECDVAENPAVANITFCDRKKRVKERVKELVNRLNIEDKIRFMVVTSENVSRLQILTYEWWSKVLHGVSYTGPGIHFSEVVPGAMSFPQVIFTTASSQAFHK